MTRQSIKKMGILAGVLGSALLAVLSARAQSNDAPSPPPPMQEHSGGRRGGGPMAATLADLNLTPEQKKAVRDAQMESMEKMRGLRDDSTLDQGARRRQMMAIQHDEIGKIRAVLTPDQRAKFDVKLGEMREQMRARRAGGVAPGNEGSAPPPSQPAPPPQN